MAAEWRSMTPIQKRDDGRPEEQVANAEAVPERSPDELLSHCLMHDPELVFPGEARHRCAVRGLVEEPVLRRFLRFWGKVIGDKKPQIRCQIAEQAGHLAQVA